jgi:XTP/dITP diphosphohydrolase
LKIARLVVASKNREKMAEIEAVLVASGLVAEIVGGLDWPEVDETGTTLEQNALLKARAVRAATGLPSLADDTGLSVAALDGAPGVQTARFAGPDATYDDNVSKLLAVMEGVTDRRASFRTVVALALPNGIEVLAEGKLDGFIAEMRRGHSGFGYDPIFEVGTQTLAELGTDVKNGMSHRARALAALATLIREHSDDA